MKKLLTILLLVTLLLSLTVTAFADETGSTTTGSTATITVNDDRTYDVYQIFTGDLYNGVLSNIKWGKNGKLPDYVEVGNAVSEDILNALEAVNGTEKSDSDKLAVIEKYVDLTGTKYGQVSKNSKLENVPTGYYLLKDVTVLSDGQERSEYVVKLVADITVTAKAGEVTGEKEVMDTNDSTGNTSWGSSADYDIGDDVPFILTGKVTDKYAQYETYYFCFEDTLSSGLTFNQNSVEVYVDGTKITTDYVVETTNLGEGDSCTFHVKFEDLKNIKDSDNNALVKANSVITVEYTAKLNENATIGSTGNSNELKITYSNDPNSYSKGTTPDSKVVVFTYKLITNKVDDDNEELTGAGFTLYKKIKDSSETGYTWKQIGNEVSGKEMTTFTWPGIDDGDYKLVETTTPPGYNTMEDILFTVSATSKDESGTITLDTLTSTKTGSSSSENFGETAVAAGTITATITNHKGTVLPKTGAEGTMTFITVGSLLVLASVVFLVTRKRMSIYED